MFIKFLMYLIYFFIISQKTAKREIKFVLVQDGLPPCKHYRVDSAHLRYIKRFKNEKQEKRQGQKIS